MDCDTHIHSCFSFDCDTTYTEICQAALKRRLAMITITDHCDMVAGKDGVEGYMAEEERRREAHEKACQEFPGLKILYGIEIGNATDRPKETERFLAARQFDFVLGAIHFLMGDVDIYDLPFKNEEDIDHMFREYFSAVEELVELSGFDALAHLDYPLRLLEGKIPSPTIEGYADLVEPILEKMVKGGIALEINTHGLYDWQGRVGPELWVLKRYRELGGIDVTIGSDAHFPEHVGEGFSEAVDALKKTGFDSFTIFRNRTPVRIPIETGR